MKKLIFVFLTIIFFVIMDLGLFKNGNIGPLIRENITNVIRKKYSNSEYQEDVNKVINKQIYTNIVESIPQVYLYSTHENETYLLDEELNIAPTVKDASLYLKNELQKLDVETIVEKSSFMDLLLLNNWSYDSLYKVSRMYLENAIKRYDNMLYIDIHRDSIKKNASTIEINNKKYAKVLFVIGVSHDNYEQNLAVSEKLNEIITSNVQISRGILKKAANNANGIYNQDLHKNVILIEVGGYQNTYEEVTNTMEVLALAIKEYLND